MEFFIHANSFAAPFVSEETTRYVQGEDASSALEAYGRVYKPYAADVYASADAFHKREKPLARWRSNKARRLDEVTANKGSYSYEGVNEHAFKVDDQLYTVVEPREGSLV